MMAREKEVEESPHKKKVGLPIGQAHSLWNQLILFFTNLITNDELNNRTSVQLTTSLCHVRGNWLMV